MAFVLDFAIFMPLFKGHFGLGETHKLGWILLQQLDSSHPHVRLFSCIFLVVKFVDFLIWV